MGPSNRVAPVQVSFEVIGLGQVSRGNESSGAQEPCGLFGSARVSLDKGLDIQILGLDFRGFD